MALTELQCLDGLLSASARVAVGLGFAASEENWALCIFVLREVLDAAQMAMLLPTAGRKKNGTPSANNIQRSSLALLSSVLERFGQRGRRVLKHVPLIPQPASQRAYC